MMQQVIDFHNACREVALNRANKSLNYAIGYAEAGERMYGPNEIQVQCLYILNNITGWRGPVAKETRETLKRLSKPAAWKELV